MLHEAPTFVGQAAGHREGGARDRQRPVVALSDDRAAALDADLATFRPRMAHERWIERAAFSPPATAPGFEAAIGKL